MQSKSVKIQIIEFANEFRANTLRMCPNVLKINPMSDWQQTHAELAKHIICTVLKCYVCVWMWINKRQI